MPATTQVLVDEFVVTRCFDGTRQRAFEAFSETAYLLTWWTPAGFRWVGCKIDLGPGGSYLYCLRGPDGNEIWARFVYTEIVESVRLVFKLVLLDDAGEPLRHPVRGERALEIVNTLHFREHAGKSSVSLLVRDAAADELPELGACCGPASHRRPRLDALGDWVAASGCEAG